MFAVAPLGQPSPGPLQGHMQCLHPELSSSVMLPALPEAVALLSAVTIQRGLEGKRHCCTGKWMPGRMSGAKAAANTAAQDAQGRGLQQCGGMAVHAACTGATKPASCKQK